MTIPDDDDTGGNGTPGEPRPDEIDGDGHRDAAATAEKIPVAVFISGRGSNLVALAEAAAAPDYPARIAVVVSDNAEAAGLAFAAAHGIPVAVVRRGEHPTRDAFDQALELAASDHGAKVICLAGFMRILGAPFVGRWTGRMLNIHPSLLPAFRGLDTHARAIAAGVSEHGATVHLVTADLDDGPVLAQVRVPVMAGDDPATLAERILDAEHALYPSALAGFLRSRR